MMKILTPKRKGTELPMKTFVGDSGRTYLVFRAGRSYHVFTETDAKKAATDCGNPKGTTTQAKWRKIWND